MKAREWRLTVEGELSDRAGQAFAGMALTHEGGNTVLAGRIRDQAELHGHLQRVSDLGLTLLNATVVDEPSGPRRQAAEPPPARARPSDTSSDR
jgi:outer membrane PBP1 activator LpoA protein